MSADFGRLQNEISRAEKFVDGFHFDVMDGHFVPNLTAGAPILKKLKTAKIFDVHLMILNPEKFIDDFVAAGADQISIHAEISNPQKVLRQIQKLKIPAGIVFNPQTEIDFELCETADFILQMSVEPGFGGQKFIAEVLPKIQKMREKFPEKNIEIDGGINSETFKIAKNAGVNWFVSGSFFWGNENLEKCAGKFRG